MATDIRTEVFQKQLKSLWTFAAQHAGELHRRDMFGEPACQYEFGQRILARVKRPESKFAPRLQAAVFLGYAPGVTNGYFVMRGDGVIEVTSNITDDTALDAPKPVLQDDQKPRPSSKEKASDLNQRNPLNSGC